MTLPRSIRGVGWAGLVAWTVWLGMTASAAGFVARYGYPLPFADEWSMLPAMAGQQPVTLDWLWAAHNEHRLFLPRLVYLGLGWAAGWDFRLMAQVNVALLALLAAALMGTARALRGRTTLGDAVFPLVLLSWSHHANMAWCFQLCFVLSVVLSTLALAMIVLSPRLTLARAAAITVCVLGAGACGAMGICYALPIAGWLLLSSLAGGKGDSPHLPERPATNLRSVPGFAQMGAVPFSRMSRAGLCGLAALLAGFVGLYFWDLTLPSHHGRPPGLAACMGTALKFVAGALGPGGRELWPVSALVVLWALAAAAHREIMVWIRQPEERSRAAGLLAFLAGMAILAAGIAWGRSFVGPGMGFNDRYVTLSAPLVVLFYLHATLHGNPRWTVHVDAVMLAVLIAAAWVGTHKGVFLERENTGAVENLAADMRQGLSPAALAVRHGDRLAFDTIESFADRLAVFRQARLGPYRDGLPHERPVRVRRIAQLADPSQPPQWTPIAPGATFSQSFTIAPGERLERIDLQWSPRGSRWAEALAWTLAEVTAQGQRRPLATGRIGQADVRGQYATLIIAPAAGGPKRLELILAPADDPRARPAHLPLDNSASSLRAFLFVAPVGQ